MSLERKVCTFYLDSYYFGIDVAKIQEVIRYQETTIVPLADSRISGLINLRGQIVTAINMRSRLEFPLNFDDWRPTNIIIRTDDGGVSLWVDDIGDVIDIPMENFESPPENLDGEIRKVLREVCKFENKLLLLLDIDQLLVLNHTEHA